MQDQVGVVGVSQGQVQGAQVQADESQVRRVQVCDEGDAQGQGGQIQVDAHVQDQCRGVGDDVQDQGGAYVQDQGGAVGNRQSQVQGGQLQGDEGQAKGAQVQARGAQVQGGQVQADGGVQDQCVDTNVQDQCGVDDVGVQDQDGKKGQAEAQVSVQLCLGCRGFHPK